MKKTILSLIALFILFCGTTVMADTEVIIDFSGKEEVNKNIMGILPGTEDSETEDTHFKLTKNKDIAYCSQGSLKNPENEEDATWNNCKTLNDSNSVSLAYIYENGYGSYTEGYSSPKYLVGNNKYTDYFITQAAVWNFTSTPNWFNENFDINNHTYKGKSNDVTVKISNLIKDAEAAQSGPKLSIESTADNMSFSLKDNYYISSGIKVSGTYLNSKITVKVEGQNGAFATTDVNAKTGSNLFENGSTIYIKIPVNNVANKENITFNLSASATSAINAGNVLECQYSGSEYSSENIQKIIIYNANNKQVTANKSFSTAMFEVIISKKDNKNNMLNGAVLALKNGSTILKRWNSKETGEAISLLPGTYTLIEEKTPNGYIKKNNEINFEIKTDGKIYVNNKVVEKLELINDPIIIKISKISINKAEELPGATLIIKDKEGNIAKDIDGNSLEWVTTNQPQSFHIAAGTYILEETKAPIGYELSDKKIEFTVKEDGTVTMEKGILNKEILVKNNLIVFENTPEPEQVQTGSIIIYIIIGIGIVAIGVTTFIILKKYKK